VLVVLAFSNILSHTEGEMTTFSEQVSFHLLRKMVVMTVFLAIVESGSFYDSPCDWNISSIRESRYQTFLKETGCGNLLCLRTLNNTVLFNVSVKYFDRFLPSIDGNFMTAHPVELFNQGKQVSVALLMSGK
jgi:hypothetical protein